MELDGSFIVVVKNRGQQCGCYEEQGTAMWSIGDNHVDDVKHSGQQCAGWKV